MSWMKTSLSLSFMLLAVFLVGSCDYSWFPNREDEMRIREQLNVPKVRFTHNLEGAGQLDVVIGKAHFQEVEYGDTTDYMPTEDGDVPIMINTADQSTFYKVNVASRTVGGRPFQEGQYYTVEIRRIRGNVQIAISDDSAAKLLE